MRSCTKKQLDYSSVKVFRCLSYATNISIHKTKFDQRAYKCVFIGYSPGQKAYKLYNIDTKHIIVSRDVAFHEEIFPLQNAPSKGTEDNDVPLPIISDSFPYNESEAQEDTSNQEGAIDIDIEDNDNTGKPTVEENTELTQRCSTRVRRTPAWQNDCIVNYSVDNESTHSSTEKRDSKSEYTPNTYPYTINSNFNSAYINFLANVTSDNEPSSYEQAKESMEWQDAMKQELEALE